MRPRTGGKIGEKGERRVANKVVTNFSEGGSSLHRSRRLKKKSKTGGENQLKKMATYTKSLCRSPEAHPESGEGLCRRRRKEECWQKRKKGNERKRPKNLRGKTN